MRYVPQPSPGNIEWFDERAADRPGRRRQVLDGASACLVIAAEVLAGGHGLGRRRDIRVAQVATSIGRDLDADADEADLCLVDEIRDFLRAEEIRLRRRFPGLGAALDRLWNASVALDPGGSSRQQRSAASAH